jgi:hypothetical protein
MISRIAMPKVMRALICGLIFGAVFLSSASPSYAGKGKINLVLYKAGFVVGVSGGEGTLRYGGKDYPLSIGGVSIGATFGASKAELIGQVENIGKPSDIEGTYTAVQAGLAAAGGKKAAQLENSKGVILKVKGKQVGLEFSVDLSGMQISLK